MTLQKVGNLARFLRSVDPGVIEGTQQERLGAPSCLVLGAAAGQMAHGTGRPARGVAVPTHVDTHGFVAGVDVGLVCPAVLYRQRSALCIAASERQRSTRPTLQPARGVAPALRAATISAVPMPRAASISSASEPLTWAAA